MLQNIEFNNNDIGRILVKDIVSENFKASRVFEKYGIDFCCKGNRPLEQAVNEKGLEPVKVYSELQKYFTDENTGKDEAETMELKALITHIVEIHHTYVRETIPLLLAHTDKIAKVHGKKYPFLKDVAAIFAGVGEEMLSHLSKEEKVLFPIVRYLVDSEKFNEKPKTRGYRTIKNPIESMEAEHTGAGDAMYRIRELTNNYTLPEDACTTFAVTYKELDNFEKDLHRHVHLENNILFPRAIKLEEKLLLL